MKYVSIDLEFSGLDFTRHEAIAAGFVDCYDPQDNFYIEIKPTKLMDPEATKIHGLSWHYLQENGVDRFSAAKKIHQWLTAKKQADDLLIFVGYPVTLDFIFLDMLFKEAKLENPFYYEQLDIHTLGVSLLGFEPGFSHETLRTQLFLPQMKNKHNALSDATAQGEEFVALMKLAEKLRNVETTE